ncbi:ABC transporter permease [Phototrophicus methaneseepsis]|uniref:ABC transporter permease n=1 Tax=Phototrophicus methaneseepsis TaxID=2710758 RepID=A0A7S8EDH8_9CHLR|nr:ABC transporter permease [Phototrophicus methaneseepsis]QPC84936.1 ABC transporter permease [Phototrophicus methaneseepsis]
MKQFIFRRLILLIPVVFGVATLTFIMIHAIPGDPIQIMAGEMRDLTPAERERIAESLGLNDPLPVQYVRYMTGLLHGDMGISIASRSAVSYEIAERFPDTFILTISSMLIVIIIAFPLGMISALKHDTWVDKVAMTFALLGVSMPAFWFGIMLMLVFGLYLGWLPTVGQGKTTVEFIQSLILPSITLSMILLGLVTRMVRSSMLEVLKRDYVRTAYAKGLANRFVYFRHALPNALIPVLTVLSGQFANLLGGAVVIETVFGWPGLGRLTVNAVFRRDYQVVTGGVLVFAVIVILVNLLNDIFYSLIDPRVRLG